MNELENIIRREITDRFGAVPTPMQVHLRVLKFMADHNVKEEVHKESDESFIDCMKKGAVLDKERKEENKGTKRGNKGKKNLATPGTPAIPSSPSPAPVTQPPLTTGTRTVTLDEFMDQERKSK